MSFATWLGRCRIHVVLCVGWIAALAPATAQGPAAGHRVFGGQADVQTLMLDSNGVVDQTWTSSFASSFGTYAGVDGSLLRVVVTDPFPVGGTAGGLQRVALDGAVLWDFRYDDLGRLSHHDIAELPNGNVLIVAWEEKTEAEAIAAGRDPAILDGTFRPDHIVEIRQTGPTTGEIVWGVVRLGPSHSGLRSDEGQLRRRRRPPGAHRHQLPGSHPFARRLEPRQRHRLRRRVRPHHPQLGSTERDLGDRSQHDDRRGRGTHGRSLGQGGRHPLSLGEPSGLPSRDGARSRLRHSARTARHSGGVSRRRPLHDLPEQRSGFVRAVRASTSWSRRSMRMGRSSSTPAARTARMGRSGRTRKRAFTRSSSRAPSDCRTGTL